MIVAVLLAVFFSVSRWWAPGHAVSGWGTWEAAAHFFAVVVLWEAGYQTLVWYWERKGWRLDWDPPLKDRAHLDDESVLVEVRPPRSFPWLLHACWLVPSMIELVLFLVGPFNSF